MYADTLVCACVCVCAMTDKSFSFHNIPFYIAAPTTTLDTKLESGESIPIEERQATEITHYKGKLVTPEGATHTHTSHTHFTHVLKS